MRVFALAGMLLVALGAMLASGLPAEAAPWLKTSLQAAPASVLHKVESATKKQKQLNKSCATGKVFVAGKGCIDKDRAAKKKQKAKDAAKPVPAPPPPPKKFCKVFPAGTGGALGCAGGGEICAKLANGDTQCCCPQ